MLDVDRVLQVGRPDNDQEHSGGKPRPPLPTPQPNAQISSPSPLAYTSPVSNGRKGGTMEVNVEGWAR